MSGETFWEDLGIPPTPDRAAIRRAYARRLKTIDADREPEAFQRLRHAYETALEGSPADAAPRLSPPADPPPPDPDAFEAECRQALAGLNEAIDRRDAAAAARLFAQAWRSGHLPLEIDEGLIERLMGLVLHDPALPPAVLDEIMRCTGWDTPRREPEHLTGLKQAAIAKLAAERWYKELRTAARRSPWDRDLWRDAWKVPGWICWLLLAGLLVDAVAPGSNVRDSRRVARTLLGETGRHWLPRFSLEVGERWIKAASMHAPWLAGRIDPDWIGAIGKRIDRRRRRGRIWLTFLILLYVLLQVLGLATR